MFSIATDTSANLDCRLAGKYGLTVIPFSYYVNGEENTCTDTVGFDGAAFYAAMRAGAKVVTSQITPERYLEAMRPILARGQDILFVGMSSGISGSYNSAEMAAAQLREEFPERVIRTVDTLGASLGEGLLAVKAVECRDAGMSLEDTYALLERLQIPNRTDEQGRHRVTPHSCRHTFATLMKRAAGSDKDKLALIGHANDAQLRDYQDVAYEDLRRITNAI